MWYTARFVCTGGDGSTRWISTATRTRPRPLPPLYSWAPAQPPAFGAGSDPLRALAVSVGGGERFAAYRLSTISKAAALQFAWARGQGVGAQPTEAIKKLTANGFYAALATLHSGSPALTAEYDADLTEYKLEHPSEKQLPEVKRLMTRMTRLVKEADAELKRRKRSASAPEATSALLLEWDLVPFGCFEREARPPRRPIGYESITLLVSYIDDRLLIN